MAESLIVEKGLYVPVDRGCEYGGPSCLRCPLLVCWDEMGHEERCRAKPGYWLGTSHFQRVQRAFEGGATTIDDLCRIAGVSERTVWRWMKHNRGLLAAQPTPSRQARRSGGGDR